jgi:hypothetical protein
MEYVALSHCLGPLPEKTWITTQTLQPSYQQSIVFNALPLSFQDAVNFTKDLGYWYL